MKDYTIVVNTTEGNLALGIRELIKKGWYPVGGLTIRATGPETYQFYQAMGLDEVEAKVPQNKKQVLTEK